MAPLAAGGGAGVIGLGLADITYPRELPSRRAAWSVQVLVVLCLLGALGWQRATAIDAEVVGSGWPSPHWNAPTLRAWFEAKPRVGPMERTCPVLLFLDYQCPPCAVVHREYGERLRAAADVCVLDYPLEPECNPYVSEPAHELACELAVIVRLTRARDPEPAMRRETEIFGAAAPRRYVQMRLRELGVNSSVEPRYQEALRAIRTDVELGRRLGVEATPTFVVNGRLVPGAVSAEVYDRILAVSRDAAGATAHAIGRNPVR